MAGCTEISRRPSASEENVGASDFDEVHSESRWRSSFRKKFSKLGKKSRPMSWNCDNNYPYEDDTLGLSSQSLYPRYESLPVGMVNNFNRTVRSKSFLSSRSSFREESENASKGFLKKMFSSKKTDGSYNINSGYEGPKKSLTLQSIHEKSLGKDGKRDVVQSNQIKNRLKKFVTKGSFSNGIAKFKGRISAPQEKEITQKVETVEKCFEDPKIINNYRPKSCSISESQCKRPSADTNGCSVRNCLENDFRSMFENTQAFNGDIESLRHIDSSSEEDIQENFREKVNRNSTLFKKEVCISKKVEISSQSSIKLFHSINANGINIKNLNSIVLRSSSFEKLNASYLPETSTDHSVKTHNSLKAQPLNSSAEALEKSLERVENSLKKLNSSSERTNTSSTSLNSVKPSIETMYEQTLNEILEENLHNLGVEAINESFSNENSEDSILGDDTEENILKPVDKIENSKDTESNDKAAVGTALLEGKALQEPSSHYPKIPEEKLGLEAEEISGKQNTPVNIMPKINSCDYAESLWNRRLRKPILCLKYGIEQTPLMNNLYVYNPSETSLNIVSNAKEPFVFAKLFNIQNSLNNKELYFKYKDYYSRFFLQDGARYNGISKHYLGNSNLFINPPRESSKYIETAFISGISSESECFIINCNLSESMEDKNAKIKNIDTENCNYFNGSPTNISKENGEKTENGETEEIVENCVVLNSLKTRSNSKRKRRKKKHNDCNDVRVINAVDETKCNDKNKDNEGTQANKTLSQSQELILQKQNLKNEESVTEEEENLKEDTFEPFDPPANSFKGSRKMKEVSNSIPEIVVEDSSREFSFPLTYPEDAEQNSLAVCYALERSHSVEFENCVEDIEPLHTVRFCNSSQRTYSENEISTDDSYEHCGSFKLDRPVREQKGVRKAKELCQMCRCNHNQKNRISKIEMLKCQRNSNAGSDQHSLYDTMERCRALCSRNAKLSRQLSLKCKALDQGKIFESDSTNFDLQSRDSNESSLERVGYLQKKELSLPLPIDPDPESRRESPYRQRDKSLRWILLEGEEILASHQTPQTTLAGIAKQVDRFADFFAYAQLESEKSLHLLEEEQQRLEECSEDSEDTQDLAKDLRRHISSFADRLHLTKDRLEDTAKCYLLLDKAYEWALEAMKIVGRVKSTGAAATPEQVGTAADAIGELLQENPPVSEETFAAMLDLATKLDNQTLLQQCKMAHARCKETIALLRNRQSALLKARRQMEFDCQSFVDLNEILSIPEESNCCSPSTWATAATSLNGACRKRSGCSVGSRSRDPLSRCSSLEADDDSVFSESPFSSTPSKLPLEGRNSLRGIKETREHEDDSDASLSFVRGNNNFFRSSLGSDFRLSQNDSSPLGSSPSTMNTISGSTIRAFSSGSSSSCSSSESSGPTSEGKKDRSSLWRFSDIGIRSIEEANDNLEDRANSSSGPNSHLLIRGSQINLSNSEDLTQEEVRKNKTLLLIMQELLQTERDYVNSLEYIIENFIPELLREDIPQALRGQRNVIFGNIEKIYEFHSGYFLKALENCKSRPFTIGTIFLRYESQFYLYALYNKNKPKSDELMADFGSAFFKRMQIALGDKMDLSSYLLKPVQRMGKYALLLKQLLKECGRNEEGYEELKAAQEMVQFQLRHGNDLLAMDSLRDCDVNLKEQGRLLRQGEFIVSEGSRGKKSLRHVFLFEDLILFSKARKDPEKKNLDIFQYKQSLKTTDIGLTAQVGETPLRFEIWFRKRKPSDTFLFQSPSLEVKEAWIEEISKLLWRQALRNRKLRLHEMSSMGIGNKPCLDIRPSEDQINDRSVSINKAPPRLRLSTSASLTDASSLARRPHSVISVSSSSSSAESSTHSSSTGPTFIGTLNLGFESGDSPKPLQRSVTRTSQCSAESGIITDIYPERETEDRYPKVERSNSTATNTSVDSALSPSTSLVHTLSTPLSPLEEPPSTEIATEVISTDKNKSLLTTEV